MLRKPVLSLVFLFALAATAQKRSAPQASPFTSAPTPSHAVSARHRDQAQRLFMQGARDLQRGRTREAMAAFQRAAQLDPTEPRYSISLGVARQRAAADLIRQADRETALNETTKASADVQEAYRLAPDDPSVEEHVQSLADAEYPPPTPPAATVSAGPPVQLEPTAGRHSFHIREDERTVIDKVFAAYGIHPTIDSSVGAESVPFNIDDADFVHAERALALATNTFFVALDPARVLVAKDDHENRYKFERLAMETFRLNGMPPAEQTEMVNLARDVFSANSAFANSGQDAITVRAPVEDLAAFRNTLDGLTLGRDQLRLDVVMVEVDRTKATDIGVLLPTQTSLFNVYSEANQILQQNASLVQEIIASGLAQPGQWEQILAILVASGQLSGSILNDAFATFGGGLTMTGITTSGGAANMELNSSDVHSIDQLQLRLADQQEGTIKVGERYPIVTSSFSGVSTSGLSIAGISSSGLSSTLENLGISASELEAATETVPQIQYQDIGLSFNVTPHMEGSKGVSLKLDLKLTAIAGSSTINGIPVLDNREFKAITSLNIGESAVLTTALSRQISDAISGVPGLDDLPGFGNATDKNTSLNYSELAIVITPYLVRLTQPESAERMMVVPPPVR